MASEEWDHLVVEQVGRCDRRHAIVELGAGDLCVGIDEGLLVDPSNTLQIADIERILGASVARMLALKLAMGFLFGLGLFRRDNLRLGQHQALLGALGFRRLEPFVHGLQVVTQPHAAHAGGRDRVISAAFNAVSEFNCAAVRRTPCPRLCPWFVVRRR
jgi:hypothetical protein